MRSVIQACDQWLICNFTGHVFEFDFTEFNMAVGVDVTRVTYNFTWSHFQVQPPRKKYPDPSGTDLYPLHVSLLIKKKNWKLYCEFDPPSWPLNPKAMKSGEQFDAILVGKWYIQNREEKHPTYLKLFFKAVLKKEIKSPFKITIRSSPLKIRQYFRDYSVRKYGFKGTTCTKWPFVMLNFVVNDLW